MRVLLIDTDHCGLDIAWRAREAGHQVKWWEPPEFGKPVRSGEGFPGIEKVPGWRQHMGWAKDGLIINLFNDKKIVAELDKFRAFGFPVFGPSSKSAEWERNRGLFMKVLQKHGIEVPPFQTFNTLDEAIKFAWKTDDCFVFKTVGDEEDKSLSFVPSSPEELIGWMQAKKSHGLSLKGPCMLQEKVEIVTEVGVSAWMGATGFLPGKFNLNFEFKKLMPGDYGQNTGEMGTVTKYTAQSRLADEVLVPLEQDLMALGHIGDFDVGVGIDSKGRPLPFECSARFGWPSTPILMACHKGDPVQWMKDSLSGRDTLEVDDRCAIGVVMACPPFPKNEDPADSTGYPISGIEEVWGHVSPFDIMLAPGPVDKDGKRVLGETYQTTGNYVCVVTALGHDVHDCIAEVYATADRIKFPDRIVRTDIGAKLEKELPKLHAFGYTEAPSW